MEQNKAKLQTPSSTLTINGKLYDARTGRPLDVATKQPLPKKRSYGSFDIKPATTMHSGPARSQTLRRSGLERPQVVKPRPLAARHTRTISPVATHPAVSHFGRPAAASEAHVVSPSAVLSSVNQASASERPVGLATQVQNYSPSAALAGPAKKQHTISHNSTSHKIAQHQVEKAPTHAHKAHAAAAAKKSAGPRAAIWNFKKHFKLTPPVVIVGIVVIVILSAIACYLTVPALSLFVAAKSAGVQATYPNYVPSGYHFKGPVSYTEGDVTTKFASAGGTTFTIDQKTTYWDSGAVLDNYVLARTQNYLTYSQGGITIYTFDSQAAWVNDGILHTISGNATLSSDQILQIAASM